MDTITRSTYLHALTIFDLTWVGDIKGLSTNNFIFLRGKRLLPPRAGIKAVTRILPYPLVRYQNLN